MRDFGFVRDAQAPEGEGEPAGHGIAFERRLIDGVCPVAFVDGQPHRAAAVLDIGIEWNVRSHRLVVLGNARKELLRVHAFKFLRKLVDGIGHDPGDLSDPVFIALKVLHLAIEDLPSELARLLQNHAAIFRIGVIAEISPFIDEAFAVGINENGERI